MVSLHPSEVLRLQQSLEAERAATQDLQASLEQDGGRPHIAASQNAMVSSARDCSHLSVVPDTTQVMASCLGHPFVALETRPE